jgi:hypothetical protein
MSSTTLLILTVALVALGVSRLVAAETPLLAILAPSMAAVTLVAFLISSATLAISVGGVAVVVGVALVGGMVVAVTVSASTLQVLLVSSGPALVTTPAVVVQSLLVGFVASSVFSVRICHSSPPPRLADSSP